MMKRIIAFVLCVLVCAPALSGCKKTNAKYKYTDAEKATGHPVAFC